MSVEPLTATELAEWSKHLKDHPHFRDSDEVEFRIGDLRAFIAAIDARDEAIALLARRIEARSAFSMDANVGTLHALNEADIVVSENPIATAALSAARKAAS